MINDKHLDLLAATQITALIGNNQYLPFSNSSLRYASIAVLLNDVVINQRKFLVEFGSGLTTVLLCKLALQNKLDDFYILSIDENEGWIKVLEKIMSDMGAEKHVQLIHAPLRPNNLSKESLDWYDTGILSQVLKEINKPIDSVLVDGPSAWHEKIQLSRFPALPFLKNYMSENSIIFLDDSNREGEKQIIKEWQTLGMKHIIHNDSFTSFYIGNMFNVSI